MIHVSGLPLPTMAYFTHLPRWGRGRRHSWSCFQVLIHECEKQGIYKPQLFVHDGRLIFDVTTQPRHVYLAISHRLLKQLCLIPSRLTCVLIIFCQLLRSFFVFLI